MCTLINQHLNKKARPPETSGSSWKRITNPTKEHLKESRDMTWDM